MKTFTKILLILAAVGGVISGCAKKSQITDLQDQIDALKSDQIQTITGQISAISGSFTNLQNTDTQLKAYIETLQGQASNLETSSKNLEDAIAKLEEDLTNEITSAKSEALKQLETLKASIDVELKTLKDTIENLQEKDKDLQTRIDELKKYTETELKNAKDWATATFATLEQYNKTAEIVAGIQGQIETINDELVNAKKYTDDVKAELDKAIASLKTDLQTEIKDAADAAAQALTTASEEIKKAYTEAIEAAITASETSIKTWVNEQLSAYYTAELMDSKLEALQTALENKQNSQDENLKKLISALEKDVNAEIADLKQALADQKSDIETAYTKAISDAIKSNNGTIDQKITDALKPVTESLTALRTRLGDLQTKVKALTDRVTAIEEGLKSLTSIAYIPKYSDNKERVEYTVDGINCTPQEALTLRFDVYPESSAKAIADAYSTAISAKVVYTQTKASAGDFVDMVVTGATANGGILALTVSTDALGTDFLLGRLEASVVVRIATGYSNIQSDYIGLVPGGANATYMQYLYSNFDTDNDDKLSATELENVTELDLTDMGLTTLDITPFPNLEELYILGNPDLTKVACISFDSIMNCAVRCDEHTLFYIDGKQIKLEDYETTIDGVIWKQFNLDARIGDIGGNKYFGYQIADYVKGSSDVNICPDGYHVSTKDELTSLVKNYERDSHAVKRGIWASGSQDMKSGSSRIFIPHVEDITRLLTSTKLNSSYNPVWYMEMNERNDSFITFDYGKYDIGNMDVTEGSVRCVKDY